MAKIIESICKIFKVWGWEDQEIIVDDKYYQIRYSELDDDYTLLYYTIITDPECPISFDHSDWLAIGKSYCELNDCVEAANEYIKKLTS